MTRNIETFVILDLEGTGLPEKENNRTKIIELTCLAVSRSDIEEAKTGVLPPMRKLSFLVNPRRKLTADASKMTGLTEAELAKQPLFIDKIKCLNDFLDLPKPVCIVSHGGTRYDFPLLKAEYKDAGRVMPNHLHCVDSFYMFKYAFRNHYPMKFSLGYLYTKLTKKQPHESHRAEADCLMLLECVIAIKKDFLMYADKNLKNFRSFSSLR